MTTDVIDALAALNPVRDTPPVDGVERLLRRIDEAERVTGPGEMPQRRARSRSAVACAVLLLAACLVGLVLAGGSSGPGANVAAAAYRATSPTAGVLEADFVDHLFDRGRLIGVVQRREWADPSRGSQRAQRISRPAGRGCASVILETASAPGRVEFASGSDACPPPRGGGAPLAPKAIFRFEFANTRHPGASASEPAPAVAPGGRPRAPIPPEVLLGAARDACTCWSPSWARQGDVSPLEQEGLGLYRRLYRAGVIHLAGRAHVGARLLWKLEGVAAWTSTNTHAKRFVPSLGLVVLVDPTTFRPVLQREIDLALPGHPVTVESELIGYGQLPRDSTSGALLQISAQHPGLRVITRRAPFPRPVFQHLARR